MGTEPPVFLQLALQWPKKKEFMNISAWEKGVQAKSFRNEALWIPTLFLPGDHLPKATRCSTALSGHLKCKHNFIYFLTLGSKHLQLNEKQPLLFSNFFCSCFILAGHRGHTLTRPWCTTVTFEKFWLASRGSWCHCSLSCILSSRRKAGWLGNCYRWKFWSNRGEKKKLKWSLLEHWHPWFLFQMSQLSQHSQVLPLEYITGEQLVMLP